jgi:hypothetical protein
MATTMRNTMSPKGVSTLDVLWAFYLSQPRQVKKAFRIRLENQDKAENEKTGQLAQWQVDLKDIRSLKVGWDDKNAPRINRDAISHVDSFVKTLTDAISHNIRLFPTYLGGVMLRFETEKGRVKCEFGDKQMSYFVKRKDQVTEHHSFEDINRETMSVLKSNIESIA